MKITHNVITDLLSAYFSGEASDDTRTLVETYFQQHPEFEDLAQRGQTQLDILGVSSPTDQQEKVTLMRVKNILRLRSFLLGVALFFSFMPLSLAGDSKQGITWIMVRDLPGLAAVFAVAALLTWFFYFWSFRSVRDI